MDLEMKNGRLLLRPIKQEKKQDILVYTNDQCHKSYEAEVMATGELDGYEVGDKVIYSQYAGEDVVIDNEKFVIIDSENIWGKRKGL